jgi:hypothetical protein
MPDGEGDAPLLYTSAVKTYARPARRQRVQHRQRNEASRHGNERCQSAKSPPPAPSLLAHLHGLCLVEKASGSAASLKKALLSFSQAADARTPAASPCVNAFVRNTRGQRVRALCVHACLPATRARAQSVAVNSDVRFKATGCCRLWSYCSNCFCWPLLLLATAGHVS